MQSQHKLSPALSILLFLMGAAVVAAGYSEGRYPAPTSSDWSYEGDTGPSHWAEHYPECGGSRQSPINIESWAALGDEPFTPFKFHGYATIPDSMTITNTGHSAQVSSSDLEASIDGGGLYGEYVFAQFHFHWGSNDFTGGSEHTIDWVRWASELHLVHYKREYGGMDEAVKYPDGVVVLGVLLDLSQSDNPNLDKLVKGLPSVKEPDSSATIVPFALEDLLPRDVEAFYRYDGSLTTPGCSEAVIWTVFKQPITVSSAQLDEFRQLIFPDGQPMMDNFRPTQPLNGREVYTGQVEGYL
ncbi:carbonic anhydrase 2 isoform X1 [Procambarus clarkii]|uniref:carbonic anhydrase 2 isoform X1 n=1 Tax=Procambarus clarkii TaxID=6728 RepID=UPI003743AA01